MKQARKRYIKYESYPGAFQPFTEQITISSGKRAVYADNGDLLAILSPVSFGAADNPIPNVPYIYFMEAPDIQRIKIGTNHHIKRRIISIKASSPVPVTLIKAIEGGRTKEKDIHQRFKHLRQHGEWFIRTPELMQAISEIE